MKKTDVSNTTTSHNLLKGGSPYHFRFVNRNPLNTTLKKNDYIYSFVSSKTGFKYYVNCIEYNIGVFAVKFYLKIHKSSPDRYRIITNKGDAIPILKTVISIMVDVLRKNEDASFAFIGMPKKNEKKDLTKRYCVYRELCKKYFNPNSFDHFYDERWSFYSLLNKRVNTDKVYKELAKIAKEELKDEQSIREISFGRSTA